MIFAIFLIVLVVLYFLLPKGILLYEGLHWLPWVIQLKSLPLKPFREEKTFYGNHPRQYFLLIRSGKDQSPKDSVVVYIHGGGWQFGKPEMFRSNALVLVEAGYPVFMLSHRRIPFFDITDLREDLVAAMSKIREVMMANNLGAKKIILGGVSSGGNLAALMAFDPDLRRKMAWGKDMPAALFLISAPLNLRGMWSSPPLLFLAGNRSNVRFRMASPMEVMQPGQNVPTLIIHGTHDGLVNYQSVREFYEKMKAESAREVRLITIERGTHLDAASWCFPGHPANRAVIQWLKEQEVLPTDISS